MRNKTPEEFQASMEEAIKNNADLNQEAVKAMKRIMEQREEILEAFVAKYGFDPDEAVQVEFKTPQGNYAWMVRKKMETDPKV